MNTAEYYRRNARGYADRTRRIDLSMLHARFLAHLPNGALILDAGCGSGRDSRAFLDRGYRVHAFDACDQLAELATEHLGQPVQVQRFEQFEGHLACDGIWACASLLHLPETELPQVFARLWAALKPGGVLYVSFKHGEGERIDADGRHFTDATESRLRTWVAALTSVATIECWITTDFCSDNRQTWLNALLHRAPVAANKLITGGRENPLLPELIDAIATSSEIDLAVAFVKVTGLRMLMPDLLNVLTNYKNYGESRPPARVRILTSDYLDITDPEALQLLLLLQEQGAEVRIFQSAGSSFHLKAYIFASFDPQRGLNGVAFIGSSNISRQALTDGLEWNYRVIHPDGEGYIEARNRFEELFRDPRTEVLTDEWLNAYALRRKPPIRAVELGSDETEPLPIPTRIQSEALQALEATRRLGYRRGLVVLATGLGKTWLAAFLADQMSAARVLFVAHREEILAQAAETFARIKPFASIGYYMGKTRDLHVEILCASVQTLGREVHFSKFRPYHFDYIVIDEFHHAAAPTYRRLLSYFQPQFLLGLTATPNRTDQSDILALCDGNLVYSRDLFAGIEASLLAPFRYYGIWDESVDYQEIPWRSGRFDPEALSAKLATLARVRHVIREWRARAQRRTLAFCVSVRHADFMADHFEEEGVRAAAVYAGSKLSRSKALAQLESGDLQVIFSVDLFNEGVDLPLIDTVMMLRPTESSILFLQQLGRGLRKTDGKEHLVVLDFIGNHHAFLHKVQALGRIEANYKALAEFARRVEEERLSLPPGCFINYDLELIHFLKSLDGDGTAIEYKALSDSLGRRPTLSEFYRAGGSVSDMRREYGSWFELVASFDHLDPAEIAVVSRHREFLRELETTPMPKSFKMVLLEAFQDLDGWQTPPSLSHLAKRSREVLERHRPLLDDLPDEIRKDWQNDTDAHRQAVMADADASVKREWVEYWRKNPVNAWVGGNQKNAIRPWFGIENENSGEAFDGTFVPNFEVLPDERESLSALVQELIDFRMARYETRLTGGDTSRSSNPSAGFGATSDGFLTELAYFPNLQMACGHFRAGRADAEEFRSLGPNHGRLNPARYFIAKATGNSMEGGDQPIRDGDYLLLEHLGTPAEFAALHGERVALERPNSTQQSASEMQYLLRIPEVGRDGSLLLRAANPAYSDLIPDASMRPVARVCAVLDPLEFAVGRSFSREEIPALFGVEFNPGSWNCGHVVLSESQAHILLVTLNKQGKAAHQRYMDRWIDARTFQWQTQNQTTPASKRGREIIEHERLGIALHLFVREEKLKDKKAAPFVYHGRVRYQSHSGTRPMTVELRLGG